MDGKESTPARPHGEAGTKATTSADGASGDAAEGPAAPAEQPPSTTRDQATEPSAAAAAEDQPSPSTPAQPVGPTPAGAAPAPAAAEPAAVAPAADEPAAGPPAYGATRQAHPKIFDLPDHHDGARRGNGGPLVLGGAAAAEGRTSGSHARIAGPASPPGGDGAAADDEGEPRGRHFAAAASTALTERWPLLVAAVPVFALVLLIGAWAIDTAALSGQVMRNVQVAGRDVGGLGEASLPDVMDQIDDELAARPVVVTAGDRRYETTAGEIGLTVDTEATAEAALDAGRSDSLLTRPFAWLGSFFGERDVEVQYSVKESQVVAKMLELQGPELLAPHDPTIQLGEDGWVAVPGIPGQGVDTDEIAAELPAAAGDGGSGGASSSDDTSGSDDDGDDRPIRIQTALVEVAPRFTDAEAQELADQANAMTANGLTLTAGDVSKTVPSETLRTWIAPTTEDGSLRLTIVPDAVNAAVPEIFGDLSAEPRNASFDLQSGVPVVIPSEQGVVCCGTNSADLVWQALESGAGTAALEVQSTDPEITTEEAQGFGIVQAVGGNNAWRNGAPTTAGPGFTTYYDPGQPRVTNIHRIADIVRGTIIPPGETFSMNETVGPRTEAKGFVLAGAIRDGAHVEEIGGGVSQFATTTFNAAYFAALDIPTYQAHTEWFARYPPGREATMGYPAPDLKIKNNTPYGVMIWTSYTANSVTVTMYSTPYATAEQTGITESTSGACRNVTTTRTRTFPDGHTDQQTFRATYRPGEGQTC